MNNYNNINTFIRIQLKLLGVPATTTTLVAVIGLFKVISIAAATAAERTNVTAFVPRIAWPQRCWRAVLFTFH